MGQPKIKRVKRGFASPLCPWYLRDYGRYAGRCPFGGSFIGFVQNQHCALHSVPAVAVLLPERFRVGYAFGGMRSMRSPATGTRTIPKKRRAGQPCVYA